MVSFLGGENRLVGYWWGLKVCVQNFLFLSYLFSPLVDSLSVYLR